MEDLNDDELLDDLISQATSQQDKKPSVSEDDDDDDQQLDDILAQAEAQSQANASEAHAPPNETHQDQDQRDPKSLAEDQDPEDQANVSWASLQSAAMQDSSDEEDEAPKDEFPHDVHATLSDKTCAGKSSSTGMEQVNSDNISERPEVVCPSANELSKDESTMQVNDEISAVGDGEEEVNADNLTESHALEEVMLQTNDAGVSAGPTDENKVDDETLPVDTVEDDLAVQHANAAASWAALRAEAESSDEEEASEKPSDVRKDLQVGTAEEALTHDAMDANSERVQPCPAPEVNSSVAHSRVVDEAPLHGSNVQVPNENVDELVATDGGGFEAVDDADTTAAPDTAPDATESTSSRMHESHVDKQTDADAISAGFPSVKKSSAPSMGSDVNDDTASIGDKTGDDDASGGDSLPAKYAGWKRKSSKSKPGQDYLTSPGGKTKKWIKAILKEEALSAKTKDEEIAISSNGAVEKEFPAPRVLDYENTAMDVDESSAAKASESVASKSVPDADPSESAPAGNCLPTEPAQAEPTEVASEPKEVELEHTEVAPELKENASEQNQVTTEEPPSKRARSSARVQKSKEPTSVNLGIHIGKLLNKKNSGEMLFGQLLDELSSHFNFDARSEKTAIKDMLLSQLRVRLSS